MQCMNICRMLGLSVFFCFSGVSGHVLAADHMEMQCKGSKFYDVIYEVKSNVLKMSNQSAGSIKVLKVQNDSDGILIWATVPAIGGNVKRDVLILFGKEKWVKYFFGNGSNTTDKCD